MNAVIEITHTWCERHLREARRGQALGPGEPVALIGHRQGGSRNSGPR